jgi:hypothetical protein
VERQGIWRIRTTQALRELYKDLDRAADIKKTGINRIPRKDGWNGELRNYL